MMASGTVIAVLVLYLLVLLAIGRWGGKESGEVAGYYVAGKKLPSWVIAFSSNTTGESAWLMERDFKTRIARLRHSKAWGDLGDLKRELLDFWTEERNTLAKEVMQDIEAQRRKAKGR